jgi:hypothetical protein
MLIIRKIIQKPEMMYITSIFPSYTRPAAAMIKYNAYPAGACTCIVTTDSVTVNLHNSI